MPRFRDRGGRRGDGRGCRVARRMIVVAARGVARRRAHQLRRVRLEREVHVVAGYLHLHPRGGGCLRPHARPVRGEPDGACRLDSIPRPLRVDDSPRRRHHPRTTASNSMDSRRAPSSRDANLRARRVARDRVRPPRARSATLGPAEARVLAVDRGRRRLRAACANLYARLAGCDDF